MRLFAQICIGLCLAAACDAQTASSCSHRTILVNVLNGNRPLNELIPSNFHGAIHHKAVTIASVRPATRPRRLVLLFDGSESMRETDSKWKLANAAASMVVDNAPQDLSLCLAEFAGSTHQLTTFKDNREVIQRELVNLNARKRQTGSRISISTALLDAVAYAANFMQPTQPGDVVLLVTDGGENHSDENVAKLHRLLLASGIRVFSIFLQDQTPILNPVEEQGEDNFQDLARSTGGAELTVPSSSPGPFHASYSVSKADFDRLNSRIRGMYLAIMSPSELEIELPVRLTKIEEWKLQYKDDRLGKSPIQVFYPADLLPCDTK